MRKLLFAILAILWFCGLLAPLRGGATLPSDTAWEVRPTNGDNTFGACFSATQAVASSGTGTDQTQSNSAALSLTNGTTSGAGATTLTTATASSFTAAMQGNCVRINSGTNATVGWYMINSVTDGQNVVLDRTPTAGGAGSSINFKVGGATKSLSGQTTTALFGASTSVQPGNTVWIKNEAWNEAVTTAGGNNGTNALPIIVEGYNTSRGDNPTGSNRPHNNRASASGVGILSVKAGVIWKHIWVSNAGSHGWQDTTGGTFLINCRSSSNGATGFTLSGSPVTLIGVEADSNTTIGVNNSASAFAVMGSYIHGNTTTGITTSVGTPIVLVNNIIAANGSHGVAVTGNTTMQLFSNTIDGNTGATTDGLNVATGAVIAIGSTFMNNIFSNNGRDGVRAVDASTSYESWFDYNDFYGNGGTARTNVRTGPHDLASNPSYTATGSGNYSIGTALRLQAWPGAFPGGGSTGAFDIGAVQSGLGAVGQSTSACPN